MKTHVKLAIGLPLLIFAFSVSNLQAQNSEFQVTFNVDMSTAAGFDPESDVVFMTGSMFGWAEPGSQPPLQTMQRVGSTMIWTNTLILLAGEYQYKFFINYGWGWGEWAGEPNRVIQITEDVTFDNTWGINDFGGQTHAVTFNVDMSLYPFFDPTNDMVYITGSYNGWSEPGINPGEQLMTQVYDTMIWTKTLDLPSGPNLYKYFINPGWGHGEWQDLRSRWVYIDQDIVIDDHWANCFPATLPFSEGFENTPLWQSPDCWFTNGDLDWHIEVIDYNAAEGQQSLKMYHADNSFALLISPYIDEDLSNLQIGFKALKDWSNTPLAKLVVGVIENPALPESFVPLQEFAVTNHPGEPFQNFLCYLNDYNGQAGHIAIKVGGVDESNWNNVFVDYIVIDFIPACPPPHNLMAINITTEEALLSWSQSGTDATSWDIVYGIHGFDPFSEGTMVLDISQAGYLLEGLNHSTHYDFYVRAQCDMETTQWSEPQEFWTECMGEAFTFLTPTPGQVIDLGINNFLEFSYAFVGCADFWVNIDLFDEFQNHVSWFHSDNITGSVVVEHDLELPMALCSGNYSIRLSYWNESNQTHNELFSPIFTIINNTDNVHIAQPNWWMVALTGQDIHIHWNSSNSDDVSLFYSLDNGQNWELIVENTPTSCGYFGWGYNSYTWMVPLTIAGTYDESLIKVERADNPGVFSVSQPFRITSVRPIEITSPNPGDIYLVGENIDLIFHSLEQSWIDIHFIDYFGNWMHLETFEATVGTHSRTYDTSGFPEGFNLRFSIQHQNTGLDFDSPFFAILSDVPACIEPTNIHVSDVTLNSALISWMIYGNVSSWNLEWGVNQFYLGGGNIITGIDTNPYTLSGLPQGSLICFYLQSDCGGGLVSDWAGPFYFDTGCGNIDVPFFENFDALTPYQVPACWSSWGDWNTSVVDFISHSPQYSVHFQASEFGLSMLISPEIDATLGDIRVRFKALPDESPLQKTIEVGTVPAQDQGNLFTPVGQFELYGMPGLPWQSIDVSFADYTGNDNHIAIRFINTHDEWQSFFIDDFQIDYLPACQAPYNLKANNITMNSAMLSWQQSVATEPYDLVYGPYGFDPLSEGTLVESLLVSEYEATGLNHSTFYEFYVRGHCNGTASEWSSAGLFRTDCGEASVTLVSPSDGEVFNTDLTAEIPVEISFQGCDQFSLLIMIVDEFFNNVADAIWIDINSTGTYHIDIPIPFAICSGSYAIGIQYWDQATNNWLSHYSGFFSIINDTDNVHIAQPNWWMVALTGQDIHIHWNSSNSDDISLFYSLDNGQNWALIVENTPTACGFNSYTWMVPLTIAGTYDESLIKVERADNPGVFSLSHPFRITSVRPIEITSPNPGDIYLVGENIDLIFHSLEQSWIDIHFADHFGNWMHLETFEATVGTHTRTYDTTGFTEGFDLRFSIQHQNTGHDFDSPFFAILSDVTACIEPTNIHVSDVTLNSAVIGWMIYGNVSSWNLEWGVSQFNPGGGNIITGIDTNPYTLSGLSQGSLICFYLQSDCGGGLVSDWAGPFYFDTGCGNIDVPFFENFDALTPYQVPACWASWGDWNTNVVNFISHSPPNSVHFQTSEFGLSMLISPEIDATLGDIRVRFKALPDESPLQKTIEVGTVPAQDQGDLFTPVGQFDLYGMPGQPWQSIDVSFADYTGNDNHIAIRFINTHDEWQSFFIDDFQIDYLPACQAPYNLKANNITMNSAMLSWQQSVATEPYDLVYGPYGFDPLSEGTLAESLSVPEYEATGLNHSTFYEFYVRGHCNGTTSEWSSAGLFRTDCGEASVTLVSPSGGEVFNTDLTAEIPVEISFQGCDQFSLLIMIVDEFFNNVADAIWIDINSTGTYHIDLPIPFAICSGSYAIGIQYWDQATNNWLSHYSGFFSIINDEGKLEVRQPSHNQNLLTGMYHSIAWNSNTNDPVNIFYSLDNGLNWYFIMQNVDSNCGTSPWGYNHYDWLVPATIQGTFNECRIKISSLDNPNVYTISETFMITSIHTLTFIQPEAGDIIPSGSDLDLVFSVSEPSDIDIYIYYSNGDSEHLGYFDAAAGVNTITYSTSGWPEGLDHFFGIWHYNSQIWTLGPPFAILDDVPGCLPPGFIQVLNETPTSVDISWLDYGNATSWDLEWGMNEINPGDGTIISGITQTQTTITGLTAGTWFTFYLASNCNGGLQSDWAGPFGFYTPSHYSIIAFTGENGNVSPLGLISVLPGTDQSFVIEPDNGYEVADVLVDGVSVGAVETYTFFNVTANHTIEALFNPLLDILHLAKEEDEIITGEVCYFSPSSIWVAGYGFDFTVEPGGDVTLVAAERIRLLPGTMVAGGAKLHAHIAVDGVDYCVIPEEPEPDDHLKAGSDIISDSDKLVEENNMKFFKVYPNPTEGTFTLEVTGMGKDEIISVDIFGMTGARVLNQTLPPKGLHTLSLEGHQPGIYFVRVITGKHTGIERLIKR